jgi:hypothetical protein
MPARSIKKPQQISARKINTYKEEKIQTKEKRERRKETEGNKREKGKTCPPNEMRSTSMETEPLDSPIGG